MNRSLATMRSDEAVLVGVSAVRLEAGPGRYVIFRHRYGTADGWRLFRVYQLTVLGADHVPGRAFVRDADYLSNEGERRQEDGDETTTEMSSVG